MKFYIQLELRYDIYTTDEDGDTESTYCNVKSTSELFDTEKDAINFGNSLIAQNLWMEQYAGHVGQRLVRRWGSPLVVFSLKNGARIFLSVEKVDESSNQELNDILQRVNKNRL